MRYLQLISIVMTILGMAAIVSTVVFDLDPTIALSGMLLFIAGGVKIAIVKLWFGLARFGAPAPADGMRRTASRKD